MKLLEQKSYFAFCRIPFARLPVGELRFKAPEPVEPWRPETINVFRYRSVIQRLYDNFISKEEFCRLGGDCDYKT